MRTRYVVLQARNIPDRIRTAGKSNFDRMIEIFKIESTYGENGASQMSDYSTPKTRAPPL